MPNWLNQEVIYTYSVPLFVLVIGIELIYSNLRGLRLYALKDSLTSATFALSNLGLDMLFKGVSFAVLGWCFVHRAVDWSAQGVWYWLLLVILQDLAYWTQHTVDHSSRLFWAMHSTHHNSNEYNLTTGFRSSVLQPLYRYVYFMPLAWLGFHPLHIMFVYAVTQIYGNLVHTQAIGKLGWVEKVLVTPSHHRVHHASNTPYLDKNMGMLFITWDKSEPGQNWGLLKHRDIATPQGYRDLPDGVYRFSEGFRVRANGFWYALGDDPFHAWLRTGTLSVHQNPEPLSKDPVPINVII